MEILTFGCIIEAIYEKPLIQQGVAWKREN